MVVSWADRLIVLGFNDRNVSIASWCNTQIRTFEVSVWELFRSEPAPLIGDVAVVSTIAVKINPMRGLNFLGFTFGVKYCALFTVVLSLILSAGFVEVVDSLSAVLSETLSEAEVDAGVDWFTSATWAGFDTSIKDLFSSAILEEISCCWIVRLDPRGGPFAISWENISFLSDWGLSIGVVALFKAVLWDAGRLGLISGTSLLVEHPILTSELNVEEIKRSIFL